MTTATRITAMLAKDFKVDPGQVTPDSRLEDLGVDSLGLAELLFNVEDEFGLKLPDIPTDVSTFGDVVRYIDNAIAAQRGSSVAPTAATPNTQPVS